MAGHSSAEAAATCPGPKSIATYIPGADPAFRPAAWQTPQGEFLGISPDVSAGIAQRLGVPMKFTGLQFDGIIPALNGGQINAITFLAVTDQRKQKVDFSVPWFKGFITAVVAAKSDRNIKALNDLPGLRIAVQSGSSAATLLDKSGLHLDITQYNSIVDEFSDLDLGRVDVVVVESSNAGYTVSNLQPGKFKLTGAEFGAPYYSATAISKGQPEYLAAINCAIEDMLKDGTLDQIMKKYYGDIAYRP
jgi:ABC-type amino acid transport substrate-binding protein